MALAKTTSIKDKLTDEIATFYADPLGYVMFAFPWDSDPSIQQVKLSDKYRQRFGCEFGPDVWACEFLDELGADIRERGFDGTHAVDPIQYTTASGHGIGKSVMVAWLIKFILDTRPFSKGVVTANTADQLRTKTWAELGKWHRLSITEDWFNYTAGRNAMALRHVEYGGEWNCIAQTCREENSEAFAGLHAANSTPFFIFDEGSAVPDKIYEVREGGTTDGEPMTFDFGNPTRNTGAFYENCVGKRRQRYKFRSIDSRTVQITNKKRIDDWIKDYGEDSDFVKVRVKGLFPSVGSLQFIPTGSVEEAMVRPVILDRYAPLLIGVDVARFGDDDSVIYPRIGNDARSFPIERFKGLDTVQLVGKIINTLRRFQTTGLMCSGLFIDGGGLGAGVVDQLRHLGYGPIEVQFGGGATDKTVYRFKGDEMWGNMRDALASNLILPEENDAQATELKAQLTQRQFGYTIQGNKMHLESKKDMKERLGGDAASPDIADALALTYAFEVAPLTTPIGARPAGEFAKHEFDPLEDTPFVEEVAKPMVNAHTRMHM